MRFYLYDRTRHDEQEALKEALDRYSQTGHLPDKPKERLKIRMVVSSKRRRKKGRKRWTPPRR